MEYSIYSKPLCMTEFRIVLSTMPCNQFFDIKQNQKLTACFIFIEEGKCELNSSFTTINLEENDLVYVPENAIYTLKWSAEKSIKYYMMLSISKDYSTSMIKETFGIQKIQELCNEETQQTISTIYNQIKTLDLIERTRAIGLFYNFYADALLYLKQTNRISYHPTLLKAIQFIQEHYAEQHSVAEVAKECYTSESSLYHLFQEQLNTTPAAFRNQIRIQKAIEFLKTDISIEEIAYKIGFNSPPYFYRTFQKITGMTPNKYRNVIK